MSEETPRADGREFGADDARALARSIIESAAGAQCHWTPAAVDTLAAIILWETCKAEDGEQ
jgi:hypothetical protein